MAITNNLNFTRKQLQGFAQLFRTVRENLGLTQLAVAQEAFQYRKSHCKVSRVERVAMPKVDALAIARMASVLGIPQGMLNAIDPKFEARLAVAKAATNKGFWSHKAETLSA
jgi:transcriptional regulator with XRE-family HTH domain